MEEAHKCKIVKAPASLHNPPEKNRSPFLSACCSIGKHPKLNKCRYRLQEAAEHKRKIVTTPASPCNPPGKNRSLSLSASRSTDRYPMTSKCRYRLQEAVVMTHNRCQPNTRSHPPQKPAHKHCRDMPRVFEPVYS